MKTQTLLASAKEIPNATNWHGNRRYQSAAKRTESPWLGTPHGIVENTAKVRGSCEHGRLRSNRQSRIGGGGHGRCAESKSGRTTDHASKGAPRSKRGRCLAGDLFWIQVNGVCVFPVSCKRCRHRGMHGRSVRGNGVVHFGGGKTASNFVPRSLEALRRIDLRPNQVMGGIGNLTLKIVGNRGIGWQPIGWRLSFWNSRNWKSVWHIFEWIRNGNDGKNRQGDFWHCSQ